MPKKSMKRVMDWTTVKSSIPDILNEKFGKDLIEVSSRMLLLQTCSVVSPPILTGTSAPTNQQYVLDERDRVRKNWLNFNTVTDYSDNSSQNFAIKTENTNTQRAHIEDSQCFHVNPNNHPSFDAISKEFLHENQLSTIDTPTSTSCFSGSLFGNLLNTGNSFIKDHLQVASEEPTTTIDNYVTHRSLQRSFSMDLIPVAPIKRQSLNKSYGDLLNIQL